MIRGHLGFVLYCKAASLDMKPPECRQRARQCCERLFHSVFTLREPLHIIIYCMLYCCSGCRYHTHMSQEHDDLVPNLLPRVSQDFHQRLQAGVTLQDAPLQRIGGSILQRLQHLMKKLWRGVSSGSIH